MVQRVELDMALNNRELVVSRIIQIYLIYEKKGQCAFLGKSD